MQERGFKLVQIPGSTIHTLENHENFANFRNHVQCLVMNHLNLNWNQALLMHNRPNYKLQICQTILGSLRAEYNVVTFAHNLERAVFNICNQSTEVAWLTY